LFRFYLNGVRNEYHFEELAREFISDSDFEILPIQLNGAEDIKLTGNSYLLNSNNTEDTDGIKRELYGILAGITGIHPGWGTLTGVRPLKLARMHYDVEGEVTAAMQTMKERYLISDSKAELLEEILRYQLSHIREPEPDRYSLYIGIPFCPSRCSYCAFASNVAAPDKIEDYVRYLIREIRYTGELLRDSGKQVESIYIGGGTPTTLNPEQITDVIETLYDAFRVTPGSMEFTVEAGRPDTIDSEKLKVIRSLGIDRISINPQSMKDETLRKIGRSHTAKDIARAFNEAASIGFDTINSDVIAGLPDETEDDFADTLRKLLDLGANNITVHTLSVKRGSRLREQDETYYRHNVDPVRQMLDLSREYLKEQGFCPYYIYRQKHQIGALENVGYCRENRHSLYNVRIMEEKQTIVGMGAGAIGKRYFPAEDRLERVPNVSNYEIYEERFDEMLARKNKYLGGENGN